VTIPESLPLVQADGLSIEQVLTNLLDNAVEYTPADTPIDISARAEPSEIIVEVSDYGPGLPPGTEKRVFEKFFRARPADTRRGIGLGLAISRGIIEAHGGTITALNRPGGGATFRFTIPRQETPPEVDASK
ncbi:MAG TPA: ATP-binding protein, partial [Tepidisphaeraceae bacterium]|nr:ATP-binding protein [Tepidisphaeraceae bacterium]